MVISSVSMVIQTYPVNPRSSSSSIPGQRYLQHHLLVPAPAHSHTFQDTINVCPQPISLVTFSSYNPSMSHLCCVGDKASKGDKALGLDASAIYLVNC